MALIEFKDLPNTDTPLNAENLNNNFNEIKIEEITLLTANEGFTIKYQKFFKQGNHIWGDAIIQKNEGVYSDLYNYPVKMAYAIPYAYNSYCILAGGQFGADAVGYMYVNTNDANSLTIADNFNLGKNTAKIHLDYVIS